MDAINADNIRQMMRLAHTLKGYVNETNDPYYTDLFLKTADAITERVQNIVQGRPDPAHNRIDIRC